MKPIRFTGSALFLTSFAALTQLVPACHKQSFDDYPPDGSGDGPAEASGSSGGGLGDDAMMLGESYLSDDSSSGGGDCALPDGTFTVSATPYIPPDAAPDPACTPFTSTVTFPPSTKANEAGVTCSYTPDGSPPLCAVDFTCQGLDEAGMISTITGFIQVDGTSISGSEEMQVPTGDETYDTCTYKLTYTKQ